MRICSVEALGCGGIEPFKEAPVAIQHDPCRCVAEAIRDELDVFSLFDEERHMGVAKVMEGEWFPDRAPYCR